MDRPAPKTLHLVLIACTLLTCAILIRSISYAKGDQVDLFVSGLLLYTKLTENSPEAKEYGEYPQLQVYDPHGGLAPDKVDAVVVANAVPPRQAKVVLEVFPVVGLTNWRQTEGITDLQLLENSKTPLAAIVRLDKTLSVKGREQVTFEAIDLSRIVRSYAEVDLWPVELIFKATIEPVSGETGISNNIMEFRLQMKPHD